MSDKGDMTGWATVIGAIVTGITGLWAAVTAWRKSHTEDSRAIAEAGTRRLEVQATVDNSLRDDLLARIRHLEEQVGALQERITAEITARQDLVSQIATLTSERDAARRERDVLAAKLARARAVVAAHPDTSADTLEAISDATPTPVPSGWRRPDEIPTVLLLDDEGDA